MHTLPADLWIDLIGKPYLHGARGPYAYDCYGLVIEILKRRGIDAPNESYEDTREDKNAMIQDRIGAVWKPVSIRPGAVLVFGHHGLASHCAIAIDQDRFIHACANHKTTLVTKLSRGLPPHQRFLIGSYDHVSAP